jgi:hypothetical protein
MKIKSYPGRAIEASDSLDKHGSMGLLYEANWMNANERISQTPLTTYSKSSVNVSSLGKYQDQLERAKAYEADHSQPETRTLRDFNGYKPSTLKIKKNLRQHNEWDNEPPSKTKDVIHNPLYNHTQNNWHSSDYLTNLASGKRADPKLRRSQTVIVKQPTAAASERHHLGSFQGEIDLNDFYQRRHQLRLIDEQHQNKFPNLLSVHPAPTRIDVGNGIPKNCDSMSARRISLRDHREHLSALARSDTSANRMNCYNTSSYFGHGGERCENDNGTGTARVLLNPLARNKSIKINHFDMVTTAREPQRLGPEEIDGKLCDTNGKSGKKVSKKNSFSRMFATISAGSKFPRVFLGRGGSSKSGQRAKLNLEELSEHAESQQSTSSLSTLSSSPVFTPTNVEKKNAANRSKHGSATSSDSDSFVIPRPRLIVPVHTYARKRRTGNLNSEQSISTTNGSNCDRSKGKNRETHGFGRR